MAMLGKTSSSTTNDDIFSDDDDDTGDEKSIATTDGIKEGSPADEAGLTVPRAATESTHIEDTDAEVAEQGASQRCFDTG